MTLERLEERRAEQRKRPPTITRHSLGLVGRDNDVDTSRARNELGWRTRVSYEDAMEEIRSWVKHNMWTRSIDNSIVVITGGSSGLGKALAERLIRRGASLTLIARDPAKLQLLKQQLETMSQQGGEGRDLPVRCFHRRPGRSNLRGDRGKTRPS